MQKHIGKKRLRGRIPKIGIRPTIDGREKGVRESLEIQTADLAKSVADILEKKITHPNGMPVKCVITPTIGGVAQAAEAAEIFEREGVGVSITVTPCWCYGSETMDMDPYTPKAILGFNGTEKPGAVYLAAVLAAHAQKGLPAFGIYGRDVQDIDDSSIPIDVEKKLLTFAKSALAVAWMRGKSYLSVGNVSMGIAGSIIKDGFFQDYLGMRNEYVDMSELIRRIKLEVYDTDEYEKALKWVKANCKEGTDVNEEEHKWSREELDDTWATVIKEALIVRDLMVGNPKLKELGFGEESLGHNAICAGFQGQRQWTDFMPNGDFLEAVLNSSFDWNGIRQPYIIATENDSLNGVCMLFGHLISGSAQIFSDVRTYWSPRAVKRVTGMDLPKEAEDGFIHLINSGPTCLDGTGQQSLSRLSKSSDSPGLPAIKPFWEVTGEDVKKCLEATLWRPAIKTYFRGGGFSTDFLTKGNMPVTMSRISLVKGLGPILQIAEGKTVDIPKKMHDILDKRTNETWPTTWFVPRLTGKGAFKSVYDVMNNWSANHGAICYGHIGSELIALSALLRIPVAMHNVPESRIFRPNDWKLFGTEDKEGADYRACRNLGPLYS
ncbi:MAG: L-fucose isomerase [Candidatus Lokiarchaeota archaeon]|nr:L-fucose isomerase [Candidatus Lokiarchaeota archaeon]